MLVDTNLLNNPQSALNYKSYLKSAEWHELRQKVLELQPVCRICGSANNIQVHHIDYLQYKLVPLCAKHHKEIHITKKGYRRGLNATRKMYHKLYAKERRRILYQKKHSIKVSKNI